MCEVTPAFPLHASANIFPGWVEGEGGGGGGGGGGGRGEGFNMGCFRRRICIHTHAYFIQFQAQFECFQGIKGQLLVSQPNHLHPLCAALTTY